MRILGEIGTNKNNQKVFVFINLEEESDSEKTQIFFKPKTINENAFLKEKTASKGKDVIKTNPEIRKN